MALVSFPRPHRPPITDLQVEFIAAVMAALRLIGEPATLAEIWSLMVAELQQFSRCGIEEVAAVLEAYSDTRLPTRVFRPVTLGGEEAWALTPEIRQVLSESGFLLTIR